MSDLTLALWCLSGLVALGLVVALLFWARWRDNRVLRGRMLDACGLNFGVQRARGERDGAYRARIVDVITKVPRR